MNLFEVGYPDFRRGKKIFREINEINTIEDIVSVYHFSRQRMLDDSRKSKIPAYLCLNYGKNIQVYEESFRNILKSAQWDLISVLFSKSGFSHQRHIEHAVSLGLVLEKLFNSGSGFQHDNNELVFLKENILKYNTDKKIRYQHLLSLHQELENEDFASIKQFSLDNESYLRYPQR